MRLTSHKLNREKIVDLQMTSMIDVVFLLLIFFLVTTTIIKQEEQLATAIRYRSQAAGQSTSNLEPAIVEISRRDSSIVYRLGAVQSSDREEIRRLLEQFVAKENGAFIRAANDVPFEAPAQIMADCRAVGFVLVTFVPTEASINRPNQ